MLDFVTLIFWLGIINLLKLVWTDLDTLTVDARPSWLMSGVILANYWLLGRALEMVFIAFIFLFGLNKLKKYSGLIGLSEGDVTILAWVIPAMWLLSIWHLVIFLIAYITILCFFKFVLKKNSGIPATIPITIGFCIVWSFITLFPMPI